MRPREKTAAECASVGRPIQAVRAAFQEMKEQESDEDWRAAMRANAQSLVNYAAAPIGSKKYDSNWLASNTAAR